MKVMGDTCASELEDSLLLRPIFGESTDGVVTLMDDAAFLLVHGVADQRLAHLAVTLDVDADRGIGDRHRDAVLAMADVEMYFWIIPQKGFAMFVHLKHKRVGESSLLQ